MLPFPTQGGRLSAAYASWHLYLQQQQNNPKKHVSFTGPRYPRRETSRDASSRHTGCSISPSCPAPCVHDNHTPRPPTRGCSARPGQGCRRRCGDGTGRRNRLPVRDGAPAPSRAGPPSSHPQPPVITALSTWERHSMFNNTWKEANAKEEEKKSRADYFIFH